MGMYQQQKVFVRFWKNFHKSTHPGGNEGRKDKTMNKNDFISTNLEYIESLKAAGESSTEAEWIEIIEAECKEYGQEFESHEIGWIIEELDEAELVKKYAIVEYKDGSEWEREYADKEEAIAEARSSWNALSDFDKKHTDSYYVLERVGDSLDGDIVYDAMAEQEGE